MKTLQSVAFGLYLLSLSAIAASQATLSASPADLPVTLNIDAQPLDRALSEFAHQSGLQVIFRSDEVAPQLTSPPLTGTFSAEDALQKLLANSGLSYKYLNARTIAVRPVDSQKKTSATGAKTPALRLAQADPSQSGETANTENAANHNPDKPAQASKEGADSKLEEIIVTAEKREESIHDLPIAISAFSGETLTERGIGGIEDLQQLAPGFQMTVQPGLNVRVSMRGIGNQNAVAEVPVTINRDGVAYAEQNLLPGDFFDVERVEILRGPQGTISGRNATAGAIYIHSNRPTDEFEGGIKADYGSYDRLALEGFLSGPIAGERLLGRLAVRTDRADGWATNTLLDQDLGTLDQTQVRASFLGRFTDNFEALLILEGLRDRSMPLSFTYVDDGRLRPGMPTLTEVLGIPGFDPRSDDVQFDDLYDDFDTEQYNATLRLAWDLGASAKLVATTGYVDQEKSFVYDGDGTAAALVSFDDILPAIRHMSQELTLTADLTDRLDVILGALYLDSDNVQSFGLLIPPFALSISGREDRKLTSWAGYTQWRYRLTDQVRLTAGVRYTDDSKKLFQGQSVNGTPFVPIADVEDSWNAWTPRFAVDYAPSDDLALYASVSRGYASGHLFGGGVKPEFVWNYETGVKANGFDGRLRTTLTGFYMDYTNLQQALGIFDPDQGRVVPRFVNVESATNVGMELEFDALVTDQLRFSFSGAWLDATYDELQDPDPLFPEIGTPLPEAPGGPNFRDLSGNRLIFSSKWKFNASGEYRAPLAFLGGDWQGVLRASYSWQDRAYYSIYNHEAASQDAYGLLNLFGAIETIDGRWQFSAFIDNLTDERYYTVKTADAADVLIPAARSGAFIGLPRRYGIGIAYRFGAR